MGLDLHHLVVSLTELNSFSHARCDAILQHRQINIVNAYNPSKPGWARDTVYFGFLWISGWLLLVLTGLVGAWRSKDAKFTTGRWILPFFLLFGIGLFYVQLEAMAQYADTCRRVLTVPLPAKSSRFSALDPSSFDRQGPSDPITTVYHWLKHTSAN